MFSTDSPAKNTSPWHAAPWSTAGSQATCLPSKPRLTLLSVTFCPSQRVPRTLSLPQHPSLVRQVGGSRWRSLLGVNFWGVESGQKWASSPLFIPLKNDVSVQPSMLATAAQPHSPTLCLAVKNLRLALVLDLGWTDFRRTSSAWSDELLFFFLLLWLPTCKRVYCFLEGTSHSSIMQKYFSIFTF